MDKQQQHHILMECFGRIPEHYTICPLPTGKQKGHDYSRIGITARFGEVYVFEFDFPVPMQHSIPREDLESCLQHRCSTCEWGFMHSRAEDPRCGICLGPPKHPTGQCIYWEISPDAMRLAAVEYYKQLHAKHYGNACISV